MLANEAWLRLCGLKQEALHSLTPEDLLRPLPTEEGECLLQIRKGESWLEQICEVRGCGEWLEVIRLDRPPGEPGPREMADRLRTILHIARDLRTKGEVEEIIQEIGHSCKRIAKSLRTTIFITNSDETLSPIYTDDEEFREVILSMRVEKGAGLTGQVVKSGAARIVNDPLHSSVVKQIPGTPVVEESLLSVPMLSGERVLGAITLSREIHHPFNDSDLEIMSILAHQVSEILAEQELIGKLAESELKFRSLVRNAEAGLFRLDKDGDLLEINPFALRIFGIPEDEKPHLQDIWGSEDNHARFLQAINRHGRVSQFECRTLSRDGRVLELEFSGRIFAEMGYVEGVVYDRTEEKHHETESRNRLNFLENLVNQTPQPLLILRADGDLVRLNPTFEQVFEIGRRELMLGSQGRGPLDQLCELMPEVREIWQRCLKGVTVSEELKVSQARFKGRESDLHLILSAFPIHNRIGNLTDIVLQFQDITRRANLQRQLIRAQKLESIGSLAGGFAHDFKNILAGILGNANYLKLILQDNPEAVRIAETIERATGKADSLTRKMLGMARQGGEEREPLDLNALVGQMQRLVERGISKQVELSVIQEEKLPLIQGNLEQVEQVLLNLVLNSVDAVGEKGGIFVRTRSLRLNPVTLTQAIEGDPFIEIEVRDTGHGIPDDLQVKIFDPYFTTKPEGKGTGLGLAMVDAIVRSHGGRVELASRVGVGTRFRVYLPVSDRVPDVRPREVQGELARSSGNEHILVIDDEDVIRDMVTRMLGNMGYTSEAFSRGSEALAYYEEDPSRVQLVVLDMMMPEMSGLEVHERLVALNPDVRILICSGYSEEDSATLLAMPSIYGYLRKPFSIATFSQTLRNILDAPAKIAGASKETQ